jgi:VanZ family protein
MKTKWITAFYVLLLTGIVYLADHNQYQALFSVVRSVPGGDKGGHFLLMGLFSFLLNASLNCRTLNLDRGRLLLGSVLVSALVTMEEISQIFMQHRSFDLVDLLFDYLGIWVFGEMALYVWRRHSRKPGAAL